MTMKTIKKYIAFLMLATLMAVSCDKDNGSSTKEDPTFPQLVENYNVTPGETLTVTFTPNYDWTISIPTELRQWFWIQDGSFVVSELSGKASGEPVEVKIGVSETQEFDKNFSCDVTLTMDGKSEVIAKFMLPAKERTLEVASDQMVSDVIALAWSADDAEFRALVQVTSNTEWTIETPQWLDVNVPETTVGVVDLIFTGESLTDESGTVVFKNGDTVLKELTFSVPSCADFAIYTAKLSDGEFEYADEGGYAWTEDPASTINMVWLGSDFRMPLQIDSKCNWTVELPEWLTVELPDVTAGKVTATLLGVPSKYPLNDTEGKITFKLGDTVIGEISVLMPGCQDIMSFIVSMSLTELEYNYIGEVNTSTGYISSLATATLSGVKGVRVFAVETTGGVVGVENPDWFMYEMTPWDNSPEASVMQDRSFTFKVSENTGGARSAVLFILPPSVTATTSELFNADATVKSEYADYAYKVTQASMHYDNYISVNINPSAKYAYSFEKADAQKTQQLSAAFGATEHVYTLSYESPYSRDEAFMTMTIPFASYKVFAADDLTTDRSAEEGFWLSFMNAGESNNYGVVDMYSHEMPLPAEPTIGYVVFYSSNNEVLAIVECTSPVKEEEVLPEIPEGAFEDEDGDTVENADIYFVDKNAALSAKATLVRVLDTKDKNTKEEMSEGAIVLKLTVPADTPVEIALTEACMYYQMPYALSSYISVNGESYSETMGMLETAINTASVSMTAHDPIKNTKDFVKFHTSMSETYPFMVVYIRLR